jgi:hypothetical protein
MEPLDPPFKNLVPTPLFRERRVYGFKLVDGVDRTSRDQSRPPLLEIATLRDHDQIILAGSDDMRAG